MLDIDGDGAGCGCISAEHRAHLAGDPDNAPDSLFLALALSFDHVSPEDWRDIGRKFAARVVSLVRGGCSFPVDVLRVFNPVGADLARWPEEERRAVDGALRDMLVDVLCARSTDYLVKVLDGLAGIDNDLRPWLRVLDGAAGPAADGAVARLACQWAAGVLWEDTLGLDNWIVDDPQTAAREWLDGVRPRVERFADAHPECKSARDAMIAYDQLDRDESSACGTTPATPRACGRSRATRTTTATSHSTRGRRRSAAPSSRNPF